MSSSYSLRPTTRSCTAIHSVDGLDTDLDAPADFAESTAEKTAESSTPRGVVEGSTRPVPTARPSRQRAARAPAVAAEPDEANLASLSYCPSFVPFQLTDEMYARIIREPEKYGYAVLNAGVAKSPKYGHIYVEMRTPGERRPKLVDGLDWVPSSTANASSRLLRDGETELLRYYCARRTKSSAAQPLQKPFVIYQRSVMAQMKDGNPMADTYAIKRLVGEQWRSMTNVQKNPYVNEARVSTDRA